MKNLDKSGLLLWKCWVEIETRSESLQKWTLLRIIFQAEMNLIEDDVAGKKRSRLILKE